MNISKIFKVVSVIIVFSFVLFGTSSVVKYKEYKENLISSYGSDLYELMNVEAGIDNELESFLYFMCSGL